MPTPAEVHAAAPLSAAAAATVAAGRATLRAILEGRDRRPFIVVGPCSIHDTVAALDYAQRLKALAA
ncbi:MAG: 3-deoxy-7-phosphoheptulonate synthase, partial [Betaproteobacteria bacterium]